MAATGALAALPPAEAVAQEEDDRDDDQGPGDRGSEPAGRGRYSLARVRREADAQAPAVRRAAAARDAADAHHAYAAVPGFGNPVLGVRGLADVTGGEQHVIGGFVALPLDVSDRRGLAGREADLRLDEADLAVDLAHLDARADAEAAWVDVGAAERALSLTEQRLVTARGLAARVEARVRLGASTAVDLSLALREVAGVEADFARAHGDLEAARDRFRATLDLDAEAPVTTAGLGLPELPAGLSVGAAVVRARRVRAEPLLLARTVHRLRVMAQRQRAAAIDPVVVAAEVDGQTGQLGSFRVGGSVSWALPLAQTAQGERAVLGAEGQAADVARALAVRAAGRQAAAAYRALEARLAELAAVRGRALPEAERALALTDRLHETGATDVFRVLAARRDLAEVQAREGRVLREAWLARLELDRALGGEDRAAARAP